MAVGDQVDVLSRLKRLQPVNWYPSVAPFIQSLLEAPAYALSWAYSLYAYAKLQVRIATATDGFLDLISQDYFGGSLPRKGSQSDASFRALIRASIFAQKNTRQAIINALTALTGVAPTVNEPQLGSDGCDYSAFGGYSVGLSYGTTTPYTLFVDAYRPAPGTDFLAADADIYAAIERVRPVTFTVWLRIREWTDLDFSDPNNSGYLAAL